MTDREWTFGSSPKCDVWINAPTVSDQHCRLTYTKSRGFVLDDLSSTNGTFVDGNRISKPTKIEPSSNVLLGSQVLLPWPDAQTAVRIVRLGRADDNDFVIQSSNVSGYHAQILIGSHGTWSIEDLSSTNGTGLRIDNRIQAILHAAMIVADDTLMFGQYQLPVREIAPLFEPFVKPGITGKPKLSEAAVGTVVPLEAQASLGPAASSSSPAASYEGRVALNTDEKFKKLALICGALLIALLGIGYFLTRKPEAESDRSLIDQTAALDETVSPNPDLGQPQPAAELDPAVELDPAADLDPAGSLFWVLVRSADGEQTFRVGTASAVSPNRLVTAGTVVRSVEMLSQEGYPDARVVHLKSGSTFQLSATGTHASFVTLSSEASKLRQEYETAIEALRVPSNDEQDSPAIEESTSQLSTRKAMLVELGERMLQAEEALVDYDVGWLTISSTFPKNIAVLEVTKSLTPRPKQSIKLLAAPFDLEDPYFDDETDRPQSQEAFRVARILPAANRDGDRIQLEGEWGFGESNLFGSPLLDSGGRLIGVYSRHQFLEPEKVLVNAVGPRIILSIIAK